MKQEAKVTISTIRKSSDAAFDLFKKKYPWVELQDYMAVIVMGMRSCSSLEEYVKLLCASTYTYEERFDEDFGNWVQDCIEVAKVKVGKGDTSLKKYSWIHASKELVAHYEKKAWDELINLLEQKLQTV